MQTRILVYTKFTDISRNALQYACNMALDRGYGLVLMHNYDPPLNYAADAVAFSSIDSSFSITEEQLKAEADWARENFPGLIIDHRLIFGGAVASLDDLTAEFPIDFMIVGAPESQGEFWGWNDDFVDKISTLPLPVLIIPVSVSYQSITEIGFACDYLNPISPQQLSAIKRMMEVRPARLHIVHVNIPDRKDEEKRLKHRALLEEALEDYHPVYASIENTDVVATIIDYVRAKGIQLLLVIPHRHGIWYSIFKQSHTRRLTRINHLPIVALQD